MKRMDEPMRARAQEQAIEWLLHEGRDELTAEEKTQLLCWLQSHPGHVAEYLDFARIEQQLPRVLGKLPIDTGPPSVPEPTNVIRLKGAIDRDTANSSRRPGPLGKKILGLAATLIASATLIWGGVLFLKSKEPAVAVAHGDQRTLHLEDGSVVHINSQSRIRVRYTPTERRIELEGQALFNVAKDPRRPFRVTAGDAEVVAVGTQFDVYQRKGKATRVTVIEGKVDVLTHRAEAVVDAAPKDIAPKIRLTAGEQIEVDSSARARPARANVQIATAWLRREIVLNGQSLSEAVVEFNRYLSTPLVIEDAALQEMHVTGTFPAYDAGLFLSFLRESKGVVIETGDDAIRVRMEPSDLRREDGPGGFPARASLAN